MGSSSERPAGKELATSSERREAALRAMRDHDISQRRVDLSRFDAAPLIAFIVTKEMNYGTETNGRIPSRYVLTLVDCPVFWDQFNGLAARSTRARHQQTNFASKCSSWQNGGSRKTHLTDQSEVKTKLALCNAPNADVLDLKVVITTIFRSFTALA